MVNLGGCVAFWKNHPLSSAIKLIHCENIYSFASVPFAGISEGIRILNIGISCV